MSEKTLKIEQKGLDPVLPEEKKSWVSVALIWSGSVICVPALMVGGFITSGLPFKSAIFSMIAGYVIVVSYMSLLGMQASDLGLPSVVTFSGAFGKKGSRYVISSVIFFCFTCWFGLQASVCGAAFSGLMMAYGINIPIWISTALWGTIMFITAVYGFNFIDYLNRVSVPALILILIYSAIKILTNPESMALIANYTPSASTSLIAGIGLAVGGFASGAVLAGDITRYSKNRKETILGVVVGVLPAGIGTLIIGSMLAINSASLGMDNTSIVNMLTSIGNPMIGLIVLILATWTTNVANAYSAGFALLDITSLGDRYRSRTTLIAGVAGTLLAIFGILNYLNNFLNIVAIFLPPIAGVAIMDYWVIRKGDLKNWDPVPGINKAGFVSWIIGALFAILLPNFFIPTINAIAVSCICYLIFYPIFNKDNAIKGEL